MKFTVIERAKVNTLVALAIGTLGLASCAGDAPGPAIDNGNDDDDTIIEPTEGDSYLTIVGDTNVFLEAGDHAILTVKYHTANGDPLAGVVSFRIEGSSAGSTLSDDSAVTDADGLADVQIVAGYDGEASFRVYSEAEYATSVDWRVAVTEEAVEAPFTVTGLYELESQFNLVDGLPGVVGDIAEAIIGMTDDPTDPATWLIDVLLDKLDSSGAVTDAVIKTINDFRPALDEFLNDLLKEYTYGVVDVLLAVGSTFEQVSREFGMLSELEIEGSTGVDGDVLTATHTMTGVFFTIDGLRYEYSVDDLGMTDVFAEDIGITLTGETSLAIAEHSLPLSYGKLLLFALNYVIIPSIDPWADSLGELVFDYVDCDELGEQIADYVGLSNYDDTFESVCETSILVATAVVENLLEGLGGTASELVIAGDTKPMDTNGDNTVDEFVNGLWEGELKLGSSYASTLSQPDQKFIGERVEDVQ